MAPSESAPMNPPSHYDVSNFAKWSLSPAHGRHFYIHRDGVSFIRGYHAKCYLCNYGENHNYILYVAHLCERQLTDLQTLSFGMET